MYIEEKVVIPKMTEEEELKLKRILEEKIRKVEESLNTPANKLKDILYQLARIVRNIEGKSPSTTGPEIGKLLMELRCLDGAKYDKEVLLIQPKNESTETQEDCEIQEDNEHF